METTIAQNMEQIHERIRAACSRANRPPDSVRLLAVSKTVGPDSIREAFAAGQTAFGENRVQEALAKVELAPSGLQWHLIGHLQSNKVRPAAACFDMIHSIDSFKLLEQVNRAAQEAGRTIPVLLQVNVAGESTKFGLKPADTPALIAASFSLYNISICGLMTIPPWAEDTEKTRPYFTALRHLRDDLQQQHSIPLPELSMGMSHDLETAIEEGATWVRVGTDIFGARKQSPWRPASDDSFE